MPLSMVVSECVAQAFDNYNEYGWKDHLSALESLKDAADNAEYFASLVDLAEAFDLDEVEILQLDEEQQARAQAFDWGDYDF